MVLPVESYADAYNEFRNRCNIFTKRYRSFARTQGNDSFDVFPCRSQTSDCTESWAKCESLDDGGTVLCAEAEARASANENFIDIDVNSGCTAGIPTRDISKSLLILSRKKQLHSKVRL